MIHFEKLTVRNFMSIGNVPMGYDFEENKTYLVHGANGSGKSCILLDGLTFALFGKAFRNINLNGIPNSINKNECEVVLEFRIGPNKYKIERGLRPHYLNLYVNGELRKKEAGKIDYQKFLEKQILRLDERTYRQIVILGSKDYIPFMKLSTGARRVVVEDLLDLNIFSVMGNVTKSKLAGLMTDVRTNEMQIKNLEQLIAETVNTLDQLKTTGDEYVLNKQEEIANHRRSIEVIEADIDRTEKEIDDLLLTENPEQELDGLRQLQLRIVENATTIKAQVNSLNKDNLFFETNDTCSTCRQPISEEFKFGIINENNAKLAKYNETLETATSHKCKVEEKIKNQNALIAQISTKRNQVNLYKLDAQGTNRIIETLVNDIEAHSKKEGSNLGFYEQRLVDLNRDLSAAKQKDSEMMALGRRLSYIHEMLKDGGIKAKIVETYLPLINKLVRHYMDVMESNIDFQFDEKFNEIIKSRFRDNFLYANFSEGEKLRIDLALLFTWREISRLRNSAATNVVIFDEIGDSSLDSEGFECFMKILSEEKEKQCVVIISHSPEKIAGKCDRIYEYAKVKNFTALKSLTMNDTGHSLT